MVSRVLRVTVVLLCIGCGSAPITGRDGGVLPADAGANTVADGGTDAAVDDAGQPDSGVDAGHAPIDAGQPDSGVVEPFDAGAEPTTALRPVPGEVTLIQLDLPAPITIPLSTPTGESALIVGPDGTLVLLDSGNTMHADDVRNAIRALNVNELTVARGFPSAREPLELDWIIITHLHSDHMAALGSLLSGTDALKVTKGIVYRGFVDLGSSLSLSKNKTTHAHYDAFCPLTRGAYQAVDRSLCRAASVPPCESASWSGHYEATQCDGLLSGDLRTTTDDASGEAAYIALGNQARITFYGADGFVHDQASHSLTRFTPAWGYDANDQENARSLLGVISHGSFRHVFAGDMTGAGSSDGPDIESFMVAHAGGFWAPFGADVSHANHHARKTSSGPNYVASLAPNDGRKRNVVVGINEAYTGLPGTASPSSDALTAWLSGNRLAGGNFWTTDVALLNIGSDPALIVAKSNVTYQTVQGGRGYRLQTGAAPMITKTFTSVRP